MRVGPRSVQAPNPTCSKMSNYKKQEVISPNRYLKVSTLYLVAAISTVSGAQAQEFSIGAKGITGSIVINSPPGAVFDAIKDSRYQDPRRRQVLQTQGNEVLLQENFMTIPVLGKATCCYKEVELPPSSIEYSLVKSAHFKKFEGKWELKPMHGGQSTLLKLTSDVDTFVAVPFKQQITAASTKKDIARRLKNIKIIVENHSAKNNSAEELKPENTKKVSRGAAVQNL